MKSTTKKRRARRFFLSFFVLFVSSWLIFWEDLPPGDNTRGFAPDLPLHDPYVAESHPSHQPRDLRDLVFGESRREREAACRMHAQAQNQQPAFAHDAAHLDQVEFRAFLTAISRPTRRPSIPVGQANCDVRPEALHSVEEEGWISGGLMLICVFIGASFTSCFSVIVSSFHSRSTRARLAMFQPPDAGLCWIAWSHFEGGGEVEAKKGKNGKRSKKSFLLLLPFLPFFASPLPTSIKSPCRSNGRLHLSSQLRRL